MHHLYNRRLCLSFYIVGKYLVKVFFILLKNLSLLFMFTNVKSCLDYMLMKS